jgi:aminoglycoside phosphotransferase (APT) family kinase protein
MIEGVDLDVLAGWMDAQRLESGEIADVRLLHGGTQNIMIRFGRGASQFVLRRGPIHPRPQTNKVISREMVILNALKETPVPHARFIAGCADPGVLGGSVFYLMEPVDGFNAGVELPPFHRQSASVRFEMGLALVDTLAELGNVNPFDVGLEGFGKPHGFLDRQVDRWLAEYDSYSGAAEYVAEWPVPLGEVAGWLRKHQPSTSNVGIIHGDYTVANVMYKPDSPRVAAVVDWEMATLGDPLLDLGWLLATWPAAEGEEDLVNSALSRAGGLPTEQELLERYATNSQLDLEHVDWYVVMAALKFAIVLEGTYARASAGLASFEIGARLHAHALGALERAATRIARISL